MDHLCCVWLVFDMLAQLLIAALWLPAGKGLTSWLLFLMFNCVFVTFSCGILGQVWYLIVSILIFADFLTFLILLKKVCDREHVLIRYCMRSMLLSSLTPFSDLQLHLRKCDEMVVLFNRLSHSFESAFKWLL